MGLIKSEQMRDSVPVHCRHEAGIMSSFTLDIIHVHELLPFPENTALVAEKREHLPELGKFALRLGRGHSQTVFGGRTCRDSPELVQVLRHNADLISLVDEPLNGISRQGLLDMTLLS